VTSDDPSTASSATVGGVVDDTTSPTAGSGCRRCGARSADEREVCPRCGADVVTGEELPRVGERPDPFRVSPTTVRRRRRWWLPLAAVVVVSASVLGGLWALGVGPFAPPPELPAANFDAARYPMQDRELLPLTHVATRTVAAPEDARSFEPSQLVDDDSTTAWRSEPAALDEDERETIELFLEEPGWVASLVIANGDQGAPEGPDAASRILRLSILADGEGRREALLLDQPGRQEVVLDRPLLTTGLRLDVLEVTPGTATDAIGVSDLDVFGWPADAEDVDLARERAALQPATT
jgi:hypothetical protein